MFDCRAMIYPPGVGSWISRHHDAGMFSIYAQVSYPATHLDNFLSLTYSLTDIALATLSTQSHDM